MRHRLRRRHPRTLGQVDRDAQEYVWPPKMNGGQTFHTAASPVLWEYQMKGTENTTAATATMTSRATRGCAVATLRGAAT
jgi:hypothetical protein